MHDRTAPRVRDILVVDDDSVHAVISRDRLRRKTQAVDLALRRVAWQPMSREEALAMHGAGAINQIPSGADFSA